MTDVAMADALEALPNVKEFESDRCWVASVQGRVYRLLQGSFMISGFRSHISACKFKAQSSILKIQGTPFQHSVVRRVRCSSSSGRGYNPISVSGGNVEQEPFRLSLVKDVVGSLRSLAMFLVEQQYVEWPTF